ncbi:TPA: glycosyltransferase family 2 protein [Neisseria meningitidis]
MPSEAFRRHRAYRENKLQPLVSVLICAYNVEKYFAQSLATVVNQTWRNLEILIVDDGSTDGTLAIAKDFQKRDSCIKIRAHDRLLNRKQQRRDSPANTFKRRLIRALTKISREREKRRQRREQLIGKIIVPFQ